MKTARMAGKSKGVQDQAVADIQMSKSKAIAKFAKSKPSMPFAKGGAINKDKVFVSKMEKMYPQGATISPKSNSKVKKVMHEWKTGELHSGSKKGPMVKSQKQAIAIALSEARKAKKK